MARQTNRKQRRSKEGRKLSSSGYVNEWRRLGIDPVTSYELGTRSRDLHQRAERGEISGHERCDEMKLTISELVDDPGLRDQALNLVSEYQNRQRLMWAA